MNRAKAVQLVLVAAISAVLAPGSLFATTFTALNDPLAGRVFAGTAALGISGNNIVGEYGDAREYEHGFLYNTVTSAYTTLDDPFEVEGTAANGVSGNSIVGTYQDASGNFHGFLYNILTSSYTTLDDPLASAVIGPGAGTNALGIAGNNVVGWYVNASSVHGFLYNILTSSYSNLDDPLGVGGTFATGISDNNIVGSYDDASGNRHGFLYNILTSTYTTLDDPLGADGTDPNGICGNNVVGDYYDASGYLHGFLYNGSTYTTLDDPMEGVEEPYGLGTNAEGISGNSIVGYYTNTSPNADNYAFIATVPEPPSLVLCGIAAIGLAVVARRRKDHGLNKLPSFRVITLKNPAEIAVASTRSGQKLGRYLIRDPKRIR